MTYTLEEITFKELEKEHEEHERKQHETIYSDLKSQDNQMTSHPMFCVIELIDIHDISELIHEVFFTRREAEEYIKDYSYTHKKSLLIYVKSGHKNAGWQLARELMLNHKEKEKQDE